ncbi:MAG: TlpA disulfide reductase family protein [Gemmobacter sp.]
MAILRGLCLVALVYTLGGSGANAADLSTLREGEMRRLAVHSAPVAVSAIAFTDPAGAEHRLADWQGRVVVLNFWATWCAPCREEMPALDALSAAMDPADVVVLPVATGRNAVPAIERFFAEVGVENLPILLDARSRLARDMGVVGLPVTVVIDREGREVARLSGEADWNAPETHRLLRALAGSD